MPDIKYFSDAEYVWRYGLPKKKFSLLSCFCVSNKKNNIEIGTQFNKNYIRTSWVAHLETDYTDFIRRLTYIKDTDPIKARNIVNNKEDFIHGGTLAHALSILAGDLPESVLNNRDIDTNYPPVGFRCPKLHEDKAIEILNLLIDCDIDLTIKNKYKQTAYEQIMELGIAIPINQSWFQRQNNETFKHYLKNATTGHFIDRGKIEPPQYEDITEYTELLPSYDSINSV